LDSFIELIKEVNNLQELDSATVRQLVSRIEVGQAVKNPVNGKKEQKIIISYLLLPLKQIF